MPRLRVNGVSLNVETAGRGPALVLLHGFTGSAAAWAPHAAVFGEHYTTVAIDFLGHGASDAPHDPDRYRIEPAAADLLAVLDRLEVDRAAVLGYSMGGRVALHLAVTAPARVASLVLESASAGIAAPEERAARAADDAALAAFIEREGVPAFVDRWERLPLFATQARLPVETRGALRAQRLAQRAQGLANSLRGLGQGVQPPLVDRLPSVRMPALLLAGALDAKYAALSREMSRAMPDARRVIVPDAGHAVHLERPQAFQYAVLDFLAVAGGARA